MPWIFLLLPWVELWTLIELGSQTSALAALAYVFLTLMLGLAMVRRQGLALLRQAQAEGGGQLLGPQMLMDDLALVSAGLLLMVPGLITDLLALVFLVGPLRRRLFRDRIQVYEARYSRKDGQREHVTLEGDFRRLDD